VNAEPTRRFPVTVWTLLAAALALRLLPLEYGLPHTLYYDEGRYVSQAARVGSHGLRPASYDYGPFYPYVLAGAFAGIYGTGHLFGDWDSPEAFQDFYFREPGVFYAAARGVSAVAGALAALVLLAAGRRWLSHPPTRARGSMTAFLEPLRPGVRLGPWLAAGGLAVFPVAVQFGAQAKAESLVLFLLCIWLYCAGRYHRGSSAMILFLGGVALGLACAAKYNALLFLPWHVLLPWTGLRYRSVRAWSTAVGSPILGFGLGAPFAVVDLPALLDALRFNGVISSSTLAAQSVTPWAAGSTFLFGDPAGGPGPVLGVLAVVGAGALLLRGGKGGAWLVSLAVGFIAANLYANPEGMVPRYALPGIPVLLLLAGAGLDTAARPLTDRLGAPPPLLRTATVVVLLLPTIAAVVSFEIRYAHTDTRLATRAWIRERVPEGSRILMEDPVASPPLDPTSEAVGRDPRGARRAGALSRFSERPYTLYWLPVPWGMASREEANTAAHTGRLLPGFSSHDRIKLDLEYWRELDVEYVVVSSYVYERHFERRDDALPEYRSFYRRLFAEGELVHREDPGRGNRPGPVISVYRLPPGG
jgi:hypothetical protein